jgi:hypothetical protein
LIIPISLGIACSPKQTTSNVVISDNESLSYEFGKDEQLRQNAHHKKDFSRGLFIDFENNFNVQDLRLLPTTFKYSIENIALNNEATTYNFYNFFRHPTSPSYSKKIVNEF